MGRVVIISHGTRGHINPFLAPALRLLQHGHEVFWLPRRRRGGVPYEPAVPGIRVHHIDWEWLPATEVLDYAGAARDFDKYIEVNTAIRLRSIDVWVPRLKQALTELGPDQVVIDGQMWAGVIAAEQLGLPYLGYITSPAFMMPPGFECELTRALSIMDGPRRQYLARYGVNAEFVAWECLAPTVNLAFTLPELVGNFRPVPDKIMLAGPAIQFERPDDPKDFPWDRLEPGVPIVYISFGMIWFSQPDLFRAIARAAVSLGMQVVLTAGELVDTPFIHDLPSGVLAVRVTPQLEVLKRAAVCVSHGGANTVMEAAYYGVPQLIIPLCTDQPVNAFFVEKAGIGLSLDKETLTPESCARALAELTSSSSSYAAACKRVGAAYRSHDGTALAVEQIEKMMK
jgi:MGT family glycosyltransferase